jgi:uncharacterized protein YbjT (DUF2867 family)
MSTNNSAGLTVGMIGATGAVGGHAARTLVIMPEVSRLVLIGRRPLEGIAGGQIEQHLADVFAPATYTTHLAGLDVAICTFGVGQPSKVTAAELVRTDKQAVLDFATACKSAGVKHFSLLASVGADARSRNHYLRTKGELEDGLRALNFQRLSMFHPSMIITPTNRYDALQAVVLAVWPTLSHLLVGSARKYRGIAVDQLGRAIAHNLRGDFKGEETLHWDEIVTVAKT